MAAAFHADHVISATVANLGAGGAGVNAVLQVRVWCLVMVMHRLLCVRGIVSVTQKADHADGARCKRFKEKCPSSRSHLRGMAHRLPASCPDEDKLSLLDGSRRAYSHQPDPVVSIARLLRDGDTR